MLCTNCGLATLNDETNANISLFKATYMVISLKIYVIVLRTVIFLFNAHYKQACQHFYVQIYVMLAILNAIKFREE